MPKKDIDHVVVRHGRTVHDEEVAIPVATDLPTVPGIPPRESDVSFSGWVLIGGKSKRHYTSTRRFDAAAMSTRRSRSSGCNRAPAPGRRAPPAAGRRRP